MYGAFSDGEKKCRTSETAKCLTRHSRSVVAGLAGLLLLAGVTAGGIGSPEWELSWYTMDGGGAMRTYGGAFELSGTIGQPDAGTLSGGAYELTGGFWFAIESGDCNVDGAVTTSDLVLVDDCTAGPDVPFGSGRCLCLDTDHDGDIDLIDLAEHQVRFSSP